MKLIRGISFETFQQEIINRYGDVECVTDGTQHIAFLNIKCEIKNKCFTFGHSLTQDAQAKLETILTEEYGDKIQRRRGWCNYLHNSGTPEEIIEEFLSVCDFIQEIEILPTASAGRSKKVFEKKFSPLNIAKRYFYAIENEDQQLLDLSRNLLDADEFDIDIALNEPLKEDSYREHLVPCVWIHNRIIEKILDENASLTDIVLFVRHHLAIFHITSAQATIIDSVHKTSMPDDFEDFGDVFARLHAVGIDF